MSSALLYGFMGAGLAVYSNAVRKLPLMRQPWEHVIYFGVGAFIGSRIEGFKESKRKQLEEKLAQREKLAAAKDARVAARNAAPEAPQSA